MRNKKPQQKWVLRLASLSIAVLLMFGYGLSILAEDVPGQPASDSSSAVIADEIVGDEASSSSPAPEDEPVTIELQLDETLVVSGETLVASFDALLEAVETQSFALVGITSQDDVNLPASLAATTDESAPLTVEGVTWLCADFDPATAGSYTFTAVLPEGFVLAEGIVLPVITVLLREETPMGGPVPLNMQPVQVTALPSTTSYQTFNDLDNGTTPQDLTINLSVVVQPGLEEVTVELPLGYRPTATGTHPNFSMTEDIFTLVPPVFSADSIFKSYNVKHGAPGEEDTLVLTIKDKFDSATAESVALRFAFNDNYKGKIDTGSNLWMVQPTASVNGAKVHTDAAQNIKTSATNEITYNIYRFVPLTDNDYTGGTLGLRAHTYNSYWYQADFDPTYDNMVYIEVPTGSKTNSSLTTYYNNGPITHAQNSDVTDGYDRYFRYVKNVSTDWNIWYYTGKPYFVFSQQDISIMLPNTLVPGDTFDIRIGADYKKINGEVRKTNKAIAYNVGEQKEWDLYNNRYHATGDAFPATVSTTPGSIGIPLYASYGHYINTAATKNMGKVNITGVSMVLNQASTDSGKVNFNQIVAMTDRLDSTFKLPWFKWDYTIKNADGSVFSASNPTVAKLGTHSLALPALAANQYIDDIKLIPMGTDGNQEGVLPPQTSICIRYVPKAWDGELWPDGTAVPHYTPVPMEWTLNYNDDPPKGGKAKSELSYKAFVYYTSDTSAYAEVLSSNANGKKPGEIVDYEIQGYNRKFYGVGALKNPRVVVAVPKELELQDPTGLKDYIDKSKNTTVTGCVSADLISSTATHNYYAFTATGVEGTVVVGTPSFIIPIKFKVAEGTKEGSYPIPAVAITGGTPATFYNVQDYMMDNLPAVHKDQMGFAAGDHYAGQVNNHTPLTVISTLNLATSTAIKSIATGNAWANAAVVPAEHNETVNIKITLSNAGNTTFNNVRIYNILPSNGDALGSTGSISFAGIVATGATIWYTDDLVSGLPAYGVDLSAGKPNGPTWTQTPSNNATAVYIDFGTLNVAGGDNLDVEMQFTVPATGDQTAYNQFQYYAVEVSKAKTKIESKSSIAGFSTNAITLIYDENLPPVLPIGVTAADNMPLAGDSGILGLKPNNKLFVDASVPTLGGYTFVKWQDAANASNNYTSGDGIVFTVAGTVTLKAIWKAAPSTIIFNKNGGDTEANPRSKVFSLNHELIDTDFPGTLPTRAGYELLGWNTSDTATVANFGVGDKVDFADSKTVYAVWKVKTYTLSFNTDGGAPVPASQTIAYMAKAAKPSNPSKPGYGFAGWFDAASGGTIWNFTTNTMPAKNLTLYAQYVPIKYNVTFNYGGAQINDRTISVDYASLISKPTNPSWAGKTFQGWNGENGSEWKFSQYTMPNRDITLTAVWSNVFYNVTFLDWNGTELKAQVVGWNNSATPPVNPARAGWTFAGWNGNYTSVTKNETVRATYTENPVIPPVTPPTTSSSSTPPRPPVTPITPVLPDITVSSSSEGTGTGTTSSSSSGSATTSVSGGSSQSQSGVVLPEVNVPLVDPLKGDTWSLLSLLVALGSFFITIYLVIAAFRKKKAAKVNEDGDTEESNDKSSFNVFRLLSIVAGIITIVLFFIFNNLANPMEWVNRWTLLVVAGFVVNMLFSILSYRRERNKQEDEENTAPT